MAKKCFISKGCATVYDCDSYLKVLRNDVCRFITLSCIIIPAGLAP